jgi:hypothetical protein
MDAIAYNGLIFRAETASGRYWVVTKEPEAIPSGELSRLDIRMLERNSIPHVLALDVEEINSEVLLRYRIPIARSIKQIFQAGQGSLKLLLELLHSLAIILEDSRLYMLDDRKYALHPSLILLGSGVSDIHIVYLPLRSLEQKPSVRHELYQLTLQLMDWGGLSHETCPVLLDCLKSSLFELSEFKQLLIGLQTHSGIIKDSSRHNQGVEAPEPPLSLRSTEDNNEMGELERQMKPSAAVTKGQEQIVSNHRPASPGLPWDHNHPELSRSQTTTGPSSQPHFEDRLFHDGDTMRFSPGGFRLTPAIALRILLALLVLVWGAAAWKPSELLLWTALGITLAGALAYLIWKRKSVEEMEEMPDDWLAGAHAGIRPAGNFSPSAQVRESASNSKPPKAAYANHKEGKHNESKHNESKYKDSRHQEVFYEESSSHAREQPEHGRTFQWTEERRKLYADNPAQTVLLMQASTPVEAELPATELLIPATELLRSEAVLEVTVDGVVTTTMIINRDRFAFGRSPGGTDGVINGAGISRVHGEIIREGRNWSIRDLGSRNGSRLNGEPLKPNEAYPLNSGDRITAAETDFIFRVS